MVFLFLKRLVVLIIAMSYEISVVSGTTDNDFWQPASLLNSRRPVFIPGVETTKKYFWDYFANILYIKSRRLFFPIEKDKYFIIESLQRMTTEVTELFGGNESLAESFVIPLFCTCKEVLRATEQIFLECSWRCEKQKLFKMAAVPLFLWN